MMKMEVRCCCQPRKLLGWLPVRDDVYAGLIVEFIVAPDRVICIDQSPTYQYVPPDIIALPVTHWSDLTGEQTYDWRSLSRVTHLALKSEETPLERLRMIPGFVENRDTADVEVVPGVAR